MNKDDILKMRAGQELDTLIHREIMGYDPSDFINHYSTSIIAVWDVVQRLFESQQEIRIRGMTWYDGGGWVVELMDVFSKKVLYSATVEVLYPDDYYNVDPCLPICQVALMNHYRIK